jgi:predicted O-methyltransferase YrrM
VDERLRLLARETIGFMPEEEGLALYRAGLEAAPHGPLLEIGSYAGKSTIYLGAAASEAGAVLFSLDHHRGSEEQQPGQEYYDPRLTDELGRLDSLAAFRRTIALAGLEQTVIAIVGRSAMVAAHWRTPIGLVFVDGSHAEESVQADYAGWAPEVVTGGLLAIHDVFPDPSQGGQAPYHVYQRALNSGVFQEYFSEGSLRILRRLRPGI